MATGSSGHDRRLPEAGPTDRRRPRGGRYARRRHRARHADRRYASGVSPFARPETGIDGWEDIEGRKICGIQGAWCNREHGLTNGAEIVAFKGVPEVEQALLDGRCEGWLYDDSAFVSRKTLDPEKRGGFDLVVPTVADVPWGAAVRLEDLDGPLADLISEAIIDWHASGTMLALEAKWGIPETAWLRRMHEACKAGEPVGDKVRDDADS